MIVDNISKEVGLGNPFLGGVFGFWSHTFPTAPKHSLIGHHCSSASTRFVARPVSVPSFGVAHQTSLRSLTTTMSYSDSPFLTGRRIAYSGDRSRLVPDHVINQASPHELPRTAVRDGRTRNSQFRRAA